MNEKQTQQFEILMRIMDTIGSLMLSIIYSNEHMLKAQLRRVGYDIESLEATMMEEK